MWKPVAGIFIIAIAVCLLSIFIHQMYAMKRLKLVLSDYLFRLRGQQELDSSISLILIDHNTMGKHGFPFSRSLYAIVANALSAEGARVIAFDQIFDQENPQDSYGDQMLVEVTSSNENIVHAWTSSLSESPGVPIHSEVSIPSTLTFEFASGSELYNTTGAVYLPYSNLLKASALMGSIAAIPGSDGSIRKIPMLIKHNGQVHFSFSLMIACRALNVLPVEVKTGDHLLLKGDGKETKIPIDSMGQMMVNYTGDMMSLAVSRFYFHDIYESIMSGKAIVPLSVFRDKIVIIGVSDDIGSDVSSTPFDNILPNIAIHAMAIDTILQHRFLDEASDALNITILVLSVVTAALLVVFLSPWLAAPSNAMLLALLWFISYMSFSQSGLMLNLTQPITGVTLSFGATLLYSYTREIRKSRETFRRLQAAKMESLRQLVAGVVHQMNNPIGAISSNNDISSRAISRIKKIMDGENQQESKIYRQLTRVVSILGKMNQENQAAMNGLAKTVADLQHFVRLDESEWQIADVHEGIEGALALMEPEFSDRIKITKNYGEIPRIYCSPGSLNQAFMNLLRNAFESIDGTGEIHIKTFAEGDFARIEIRDTGKGVPEEDMNRIFDPGFTTKGVKVGVGLGLPSCYTIIADEHDGKIDISSEVDKGTLVVITLPQDHRRK